MARVNFDNLPDKVSMKDLSIALGLGGSLNEGVLNEIILVTRLNKLPLYFDNAMYGAKTSGGFDPIENEQGDVTKVMVNGKGKHTSTSRKTLKGSLASDGSIAVSIYTHEDEEYYSIDETGMWLETQPIYANDFYCGKKELLASELLDFTSKPTQDKKGYTQKQREDFFKKWLSTTAGIEVENDSQYQKCYKTIGEPTQKVIWMKLQKCDPQLFGFGKDDFFKDQNIISFKTGTGTGRSHKNS